jgi:hypothetical protein
MLIFLLRFADSRPCSVEYDEIQEVSPDNPERQEMSSEMDNDGYLVPRKVPARHQMASTSGPIAERNFTAPSVVQQNTVEDEEVAEYSYIYVDGKKV